VRIDTGQFGGLADRVEEGGDLRAAQRLGAVVILAADDRTAQGTFGGVVVERNARIVEKAREPGPALQHVAHGLPKLAAWQADLRKRPGLNLRDEGARPILPELVSQRLRRGISRKAAGHQPFDRVQIANVLIDLGTGRRPVLRDRLKLVCAQQWASVKPGPSRASTSYTA